MNDTADNRKWTHRSTDPGRKESLLVLLTCVTLGIAVVGGVAWALVRWLS